MKRWRKSLGWLAGGLVSLGTVAAPAGAQFPPSGGDYGVPNMPGGPGGEGPPPQEPPPPPSSLKADGAPNAFSDMYGVRAQPRGFGSLPPGPIQNYLSNLFGHPPRPGVPANFPNPCQPSCEEASPFTMQPGGMPNGFTELSDPNPRGWFHRPSLLFTELLGPCAPAPATISFRTEYLNWHISPGPLNVPLVTTSTSPSLTSFGQLGDPNTVILVNSGSDAIRYGGLNGFRATMGLAVGFLPPIEISGFLLNHTTTVFSGGSLTNPTQLLAIPFQDVNPAFVIPGSGGVGPESAYIVSLPVGNALGALGGTISITSQISFWDIEANTFIPLGDTDALKVSLILGYRHLQLNETLGISTQSGGDVGAIAFNGVIFAPGTFSTSTFDRFQTSNSFNGGQIGVRDVLTMGRWSLFTDFKLALGGVSQQLTVNGTSNLNQLVSNRPAQTAAGGILALPSNSGTFTASRFAVAPESNLSLSYQLTPGIRIFGGYNFLLLSSVTRPGDALNNIIDSRQIPTSPFFVAGAGAGNPPPPAVSHRDFIAQGVFLGLEFGF